MLCVVVISATPASPLLDLIADNTCPSEGGMQIGSRYAKSFSPSEGGWKSTIGQVRLYCKGGECEKELHYIGIDVHMRKYTTTIKGRSKKVLDQF